MKLAAVLFAIILMTGCSNWIYRIDIPQGNFLDQKDVNQLRIAMTQEQVRFVLGNPVVEDSFDNNTWYYVYDMKRGMRKRGKDFRKELVLKFDSGRLSSMTGDFEKPEEFDTPLEG
ncbi:outer membrane protein assembly factor BamE [Agaribacter marinus]|uniref:Outer membrane protein assembly factor BamE n=1 Tax=Agaribacter marinus TaxID=1431249 RepID=A0AA37T2P9_9ALTE|nr:outer membrane protein assembly factor BamE [Agaribacter marinus]GLR70600.1 outer membrane protein assembly factor BamE [Agaribacter marinus]